LATLKPVHALIFLFKYIGGDEGQSAAGVEVEPSECGVWFANQVSGGLGFSVTRANVKVINNSCGTLAALNAVMNIQPQPSAFEGESIELGVGP
jgi:ubiquitin carboxyl-terminal hydrolase L5